MARGGHRSSGPRTLAPLWRDRVASALRGGGWSRPVLLRRALAAVLVVLAAALALRPAPASATVLVAARDLAPGSTLTAADVRPQRVPAAAVPDGAVTSADTVDGRVLAGAARAGEPITDVRLLGDELTRLLAPGGGAATVPVRLSDAGVAALLGPGSEVDIVTVGEDRPAVLAERARVVTVIDAPPGAGPGAAAGGHQGRLVVVVLPTTVATQVAAASLSSSLTVTLR